MSCEPFTATKLVEDLTLNEFHAIPRANDQQLVAAIGLSCLTKWRQDAGVSSHFDLSIAQRILDEGGLACVEMPVFRQVLSKDTEVYGYKVSGPVYVTGPYYIIIPQYPTEFLTQLSTKAQPGTQLGYIKLLHGSEDEMCPSYRKMLFDSSFLFSMFGGHSAIISKLEFLLTEDPKMALYLLTIAEELGHAISNSYIRNARISHSSLVSSDFLQVLSEGLANALSLRVV